ncbi:hypothetical protein QQF64_017326 [Cirrhinus molitorella]|uniref:Reverse transcriptase RNase H-like domain-containing protein n=1 Tax=Cirrhinus molitorella TaxID=172907 RepID=A0ABR3LMD2_9TELE
MLDSWFSVLGQGKAYHQGFLDEESRPLAAFVTQWCLYHWVQVPFALSSAPSEFQWSMEECLAAKRNSVGHRWVAQLANFNFSIKYHPGKSNADADGLCQMPVNIDQFMEQCTGGVSQEVISVFIQGVLHHFTQSVEQCWEGQPPRIEEEITEGALEEQMEEDPGMPAGQPEVSGEQASVESEDDDSIPVNSYPRRERSQTKILTYELLGQPSVVEVAMNRLSVSTETQCKDCGDPGLFWR